MGMRADGGSVLRWCCGMSFVWASRVGCFAYAAFEPAAKELYQPGDWKPVSGEPILALMEVLVAVQVTFVVL